MAKNVPTTRVAGAGVKGKTGKEKMFCLRWSKQSQEKIKFHGF